jgi:hypothetical protein
MPNFFKNLFKKPISEDIDPFENLEKKGILSRVEILKIKKDRAIEKWKEEERFLRKKK